MDYNELIERLRTESLDSRKAVLSIMDLCMDAASTIETMTAELDAAIAGQETLQKELERVKAERYAVVAGNPTPPPVPQEEPKWKQRVMRTFLGGSRSE